MKPIHVHCEENNRKFKNEIGYFGHNSKEWDMFKFHTMSMSIPLFVSLFGKSVFRNYDHDHDGYISQEDFESIAANFPFLDSFCVLDKDQWVCHLCQSRNLNCDMHTASIASCLLLSHTKTVPHLHSLTLTHTHSQAQSQAHLNSNTHSHPPHTNTFSSFHTHNTHSPKTFTRVSFP